MLELKELPFIGDFLADDGWFRGREPAMGGAVHIRENKLTRVERRQLVPHAVYPLRKGAHRNVFVYPRVRTC